MESVAYAEAFLMAYTVLDNRPSGWDRDAWFEYRLAYFKDAPTYPSYGPQP